MKDAPLFVLHGIDDFLRSSNADSSFADWDLGLAIHLTHSVVRHNYLICCKLHAEKLIEVYISFVIWRQLFKALESRDIFMQMVINS